MGSVPNSPTCLAHGSLSIWCPAQTIVSSTKHGRATCIHRRSHHQIQKSTKLMDQGDLDARHGQTQHAPRHHRRCVGTPEAACIRYCRDNPQKVRVFLDNELVPIKSFGDYAKAMCPNATAVDLHPRWEVAIAMRPEDTDVSAPTFVNNIRTNRGGTHVATATGELFKYIQDTIQKKLKTKKKLRPADLRNQCWIFCERTHCQSSVWRATKRRADLQAGIVVGLQTPMDHQTIEEGLLEFDGPASRVGNPQDQRGPEQVWALHANWCCTSQS